MPQAAPFRIRPATDADAADVQDVIRGAFAEYPGCVFDIAEMPELERPASAFAEAGGAFWMAESGGRVVGCAGLWPDPGGATVELRKLYVRAEARNAGVGTALVGLVEREARGGGARVVRLWSDTRFEAAHRLYETCGYRRLGDTRDLHDLSHSVELHFEKDLAPDASDRDWGRRALGPYGRLVAGRLAEALLSDEDAGGALVPASADLVERAVRELDLLVGAGSRWLGIAFGLILALADWLPFAVVGRFRRMSRLPLAARVAYLEALEESKVGLLATLLVGLKITLTMIAFEQGPELRSTGFDRPTVATPRRLPRASAAGAPGEARP